MAEKRVPVDRSLVAVPRYRVRRREGHRRRHMARDVGKGVLIVAAAGAAVALLANIDDIKNSKEVKDHWWLLPLGIVGIGYLLRKRGNPHANAVMAVGGALFALAYAARQAAAKPQNQQPLPPPPPPQQPQKFGPGGDTGAPFGFGPAGLWVQLPDGRMLRLPSPAGPRPFNPNRIPFPTAVG
jgi:hypothetical protein